MAKDDIELIHYTQALEARMKVLHEDITYLEQARFVSSTDYLEDTLYPWEEHHGKADTVNSRMASSLARERLEILQKQMDNALELAYILEQRGITRNCEERLRLEFDIHPLSDEEHVKRELWLTKLERIVRKKFGKSCRQLGFSDDKILRRYDNGDSWLTVFKDINKLLTKNKQPIKIKKADRRSKPRINPKEGSVLPGDHIQCRANKNFGSGVYEVLDGGIDVPRREAKKRLRHLLISMAADLEGTRDHLFVTSWEHGSGHYVVRVPDSALTPSARRDSS